MFGIEKADKNVTEKRTQYVGGSDVPVILGLSKYKTQFELAKEKAGIVQPDKSSNPYIQFGNKMEPLIRDYINTMNSLNFHPDTFINKDDMIRSNVDGIDLENKMLLEIKTHGANPTERVYEAQMQLYFHQTDCDYGWLAMYHRPKNFDLEFDRKNLVIKEIERDQGYIEKILDSIETFWIRVEYLKEKTDMTEQEYYSIGNDIDKLVARVERFELQMLEFEEKAKLIKAQQKDFREQLYQKMEENDIKKIDTGDLVITRVLPTTRKSIDSTKLKKEKPDIYDQYLKESQINGSIRIKRV
ncbi:lambda-exonuclease family protein [Enterococcus lactis]|uniref:lambda-exonuclease family protein n=1 Tax=Enterococcus lactis TaxID=357441 RepID=UPI0012E255C7|nr:YqaJ viral recombinase family protein [Enterococcus lactis]EGP4828619.1 endonuclease [Enterococcus faecium]EGP5038250.1 endonuclease [Enterococcus faecium]EGP5737557.1 endonuclease [Enterococcus faecium]EMF0310665.1 YqaJ viral recombinase family protein [Enterococcus faecium]EMF0488585.1 YqaJ viral recombinase family protein [Enterococcus faecium]